MKEIRLHAQSGTCKIIIGESIGRLGRYTKSEKILVVTDSAVAKLHGDRFSKYETVILGQGERSKTLASVQKVYEKCLEMELERDSFIVGVGGGIVCDIAGFAAATYLRGINCGLVPTTLLAQVDASIGGKNGVNLKGYKNLIGTIRQPSFCLCDLDLLKTLPKEEIGSGFAEIIKNAAIADSGLFSYLEDHMEEALALDRDTLYEVVCDAVAVKARIVNSDEREKNERIKLNFGHTFGHAIERVTYLPHGKAISIGMVIEANLSVEKGLLKDSDKLRLERLLTRANLPTTISLSDGNGITDAIRKDKKRKGSSIRTVLLQGIGNAKVMNIKLEEAEKLVNGLVG